jgi:hypothetical protein
LGRSTFRSEMGDADVMINDGSAKVQLDLGWVRVVYYILEGSRISGHPSARLPQKAI